MILQGMYIFYHVLLVVPISTDNTEICELTFFWMSRYNQYNKCIVFQILGAMIINV